VEDAWTDAVEPPRRDDRRPGGRGRQHRGGHRADAPQASSNRTPEQFHAMVEAARRPSARRGLPGRALATVLVDCPPTRWTSTASFGRRTPAPTCISCGSRAPTARHTTSWLES
jgi:hypothetical protein